MELWHTQSAGSGRTRESAHRSRILTATSGNAQGYATGTKNHLDFRKPCNDNNRAVSEPQYPLSVPILGSNDKQRLGRLLHDRPYLRNPKYLNWRDRKRYDRGKDGKPVWPAYIEESFQNALVHIPAMGRHKKSQYGKLHGRNELIAEWILQDTGEIRSRKQVSSHIQVLTNLLKGDPDWVALTVATEDSNLETDNSPDFYFDSIADQVRLQRQLTAQMKRQSGDGEIWVDLLSQRHSLERLSFDMWVGLPENYAKAMHNYSRLQNSQCTTPSAPLENFKDWRGKFPDLEPILGSSTDEQFDIIVVKSRFFLMSDFPPQTAKLVHTLCLDFRNAAKDNIQALEELQAWSCVNHMYVHGQALQTKEHKQCQVNDVGVVSLAFEVGWWASQFTNFTKKRKEAEDTKDESALTTADDYSKGLFRNLTIMQEVYAAPHAEGPKKRMAVLLWVFSQASKGHAGITSWQKVVPPPHRMSTNSPLPPKLESLPPLLLDSYVTSSFDTDVTDQDFSHHDTQNAMPLSPTIYETSAYHSGFTPLNTMSSNPLRLFDFASSGTGFTPKPPIFTDLKCESFDFAAPIQPVSSFAPVQHTLTGHNIMPTTFQLLSNHNIANTAPFHILHQVEMSSPNRGQRRSLVNFDMSAHHILQAQLGPDMEDDYEVQDVDAEDVGQYEGPTPTPPELESHDPDVGMSFESQQSMAGHMNHLELDAEEEQMSQAVIADLEENSMTNHSVAFHSPKAIRPPLMAHHSSAGVLNHNSHSHTLARFHNLDTLSEPDHEQIAFDTPVRNDFARLINNHTQYESPGDLFGDHHPIIDQMAFPGVDFDTTIGRSQSQPVLPSTDDSALHFDSPMHERHALPDVKVEQM